jgi:hypothetical protein
VADQAGEPATLRGLAAFRDDVTDLFERLERTLASADQLPQRRNYPVFVNDFLRRLLDLHLKLVDEVEHELSPAAEEVI